MSRGFAQWRKIHESAERSASPMACIQYAILTTIMENIHENPA